MIVATQLLRPNLLAELLLRLVAVVVVVVAVIADFVRVLLWMMVAALLLEVVAVCELARIWWEQVLRPDEREPLRHPL